MTCTDTQLLKTNIAAIVKKIAKKRNASLQRAREDKLDCIERAYYMAETNAYNVVLDIIAQEVEEEMVWRYVHEVGISE